MIVRNIVGLVGVGLLALACSGGTDAESAGVAQEAASAYEPAEGERVLGEVDVGYGKILFVEARDARGKLSVGIMETAPSTYVTTPLDVAMAEGHTTLELFQALLPLAEVPDSLVDAHAEESKRLGRADTAISPVTFDKDAQIEKSSAGCTGVAFDESLLRNNITYTESYQNKSTLSNLSGGSSSSPLTLSVKKDGVLLKTLNATTMTACNDSNASIRARISHKETGPGAADWTKPGYAVVEVGHWWRWFRAQSLNSVQVCSELCISQYYPSYYRVEGYSATGKIFHLRTAEIKSVYHPVIK